MASGLEKSGYPIKAQRLLKSPSNSKILCLLHGLFSLGDPFDWTRTIITRNSGPRLHLEKMLRMFHGGLRGSRLETAAARKTSGILSGTETLQRKLFDGFIFHSHIPKKSKDKTTEILKARVGISRQYAAALDLCRVFAKRLLLKYNFRNSTLGCKVQVSILHSELKSREKSSTDPGA